MDEGKLFELAVHVVCARLSGPNAPTPVQASGDWIDQEIRLEWKRLRNLWSTELDRL